MYKFWKEILIKYKDALVYSLNKFFEKKAFSKIG